MMSLFITNKTDLLIFNKLSASEMFTKINEDTKEVFKKKVNINA